MLDINKAIFLSDAEYMNHICLLVENTCISLPSSFHILR